VPFETQVAIAEVPDHQPPSWEYLSFEYPIPQSANNQSHIANLPGTESLLQPPEELGTGLLQVKTHGWLQNTKGEDSLMKRYRFRLPCHKFTGYLKPGISETALLNPLRETEPLQDPAEQIRRHAHVSLEVKGFPRPAKIPKHLSANGVSSPEPTTAGTSP